MPPLPRRDDQACLQKIEDLAYDIKATLELLRAEEMHTPEKYEGAAGVYIAETVSNLRAQSDQLRRELRQRGYIVYPIEAAPGNGADIGPSSPANCSRRACRYTCWASSMA